MTNPLVGQTLANRYHLMEKVGDGGMALVYRGRDTLLGRIIAVKVLRDQFASDREFVDRFRLEAQAAASLAHPNVVNTYDVGEDGGVHFIVMEYVEGENLKERIRREGRLAPRAAVEIAVQIGRALSAAHKIGLIHRDIKPHNILITPEGSVKVTDFGIARAQSTASLTQTGTIIGSVHYFSPQQARGEGIDGASDLYSLGIVLYEMVTGQLPFAGENPVAVALKHLHDAPQRPREILPEISDRLDDLIGRLMAKTPSERPSDAGQVVRELQGIASSLTPELDRPAGRAVGEEAIEATQKMPALGRGQDERTMARRAVDDDEEASVMSPKEKAKKRGRRFLTITVILLSFAVGMAWAAQRLPDLIFPEEVRVPDVTGVGVDEARARLQERGLRLHPSIRDVYNRDVPAGLVIRQEPLAEHRVRMGREIRITVSRGPEYVVVPDIIGITKIEAQLQITQQNLTLGDVVEQFNADVPPNTVIGQDPAGGTRLEEGRPVDLIVARGNQPLPLVSMPNVRGLPLEQAKRQLEALGLVEGQLHGEPHPSAPEFQVIDQNPQPGEEVEVGYPYGLAYAVRPPASSGSASPITSGANVGERYWQSRVLIAVPDGPSQEVVILVTDDWGPRQVLREVRQGGSRFFHTVTIRGERARIQVWMDGIPHMNEEVRRSDGG